MINVFFNIDESYKEQCKTVIRSILANTKENIKFHVIGVKELNCDEAVIKCYDKPDISMLKYTNQMGHITMTATYRLFAPFILKDVDKVIYLDCDLVVLDDIKKLWDYDVKYIAGVQDGMPKYQARKNNLHHTYINSGVMVLNFKNLRKFNYMERIEATQNGKYNLSLLDQDIINIAFENEIELLPLQWNVLTKIYSEVTDKVMEARKNPSIIHWAGFQKPWNEPDLWQADKWYKYRVSSKKAIVLTYAPITEEEKKLLRETNIYKIACNNYCADLKPNIRLCADNIVDKCLECDNIPVVSLNYDLERERVINGCKLPKRHSTLLSCIDWLYLKGFNQVLLVASNPDSATCKINYEGINDIKDCLNLYKYTENGNMDIPYKSIKEFLMLTDKEKLLGITETSPKKLFEKTVFTDACKYEVWTKGLNNKSIESGNLVKNILPMDVKEKLLSGETELEYNGTCIKLLTSLEVKEEPKEEIKEEPKEEVQEEIKPVVKKKPVKKKVKK